MFLLLLCTWILGKFLRDIRLASKQIDEAQSKSKKTHIAEKTNRQDRSSSIVFWWPPASIVLDRMDVVPAEVLSGEGAQPPPRKRSRSESSPLEEDVEFVAWARDRADPNRGCIAVCRYELEPAFYWVCLAPPILDLVQALLQRDGPESSFLLGKHFNPLFYCRRCASFRHRHELYVMPFCQMGMYSRLEMVYDFLFVHYHFIYLDLNSVLSIYFIYMFMHFIYRFVEEWQP